MENPIRDKNCNYIENGKYIIYKKRGLLWERKKDKEFIELLC